MFFCVKYYDTHGVTILRNNGAYIIITTVFTYCYHIWDGIHIQPDVPSHFPSLMINVY